MCSALALSYERLNTVKNDCNKKLLPLITKVVNKLVKRDLYREVEICREGVS